MYRIAIVDQDADAREETHRLAAAFFEERGESAAFIICDNTEELPEHYDCYLRGDKNRVQLQCTTVENSSRASLRKPLDMTEFSAVLALWLGEKPDSA